MRGTSVFCQASQYLYQLTPLFFSSTLCRLICGVTKGDCLFSVSVRAPLGRATCFYAIAFCLECWSLGTSCVRGEDNDDKLPLMMYD